MENKRRTYLKQLNSNLPCFSIILLVLFLCAISVGFTELYIFYKFKISSSWLCIIILFFVLIASLVAIFIYSSKKNIITKNVNAIDVCSIVMIFYSIFMSTLFLPQFKRYYNAVSYFHITFSILFLVFFSILIARIVLFIFRNKSSTNSFSILDLYSNNLPGDIKNFYVSDCQIADDLLDRTQIVSLIKDCVFNIGSNKTKIVGIVGKWGCGKTTVWEFAKSDFLKNNGNNKDTIIVEFDVWGYNTERLLFTGLLQKIYSSLSIGALNKKVINQIELLANSVLNSTKINENFLRAIFIKRGPNDIKDLISDYLSCNNKKLVVVIDNLDRVDNDTVIFVYKALYTLLDLCNTTYVCLYDENLVQKAFDNSNMDFKYLDKILSYKIIVPNNEAGKLISIGKTCLLNYLEKYFPNYDVSLYDEDQIERAFGYIDNPRDLVRFFNYFNIKYSKSSFLNITDLVCLTVLKTINFELYDYIYQNFKLFVIQFPKFIQNYINNKEQNFMSSQSVKSLFIDEDGKSGKYYTYISLILMIFPSFQQSLPLNSEIIDQKPLCLLPASSGLYFDSYFLDKISDGFNIDKRIKSIIDKYDSDILDFDRLLKEEKAPFNFNTFMHEYSLYFSKAAKTEKFYEEIIQKFVKLSQDQDYGVQKSILLDYVFDLFKFDSRKGQDIFIEKYFCNYSLLSFLGELTELYESKLKIKNSKLSKALNKMMDDIINNNIDLINEKYLPGNLNYLFKKKNSKMEEYCSNIKITLFNLEKCILECSVNLKVGSSPSSQTIHPNYLKTLVSREKFKVLNNIVNVSFEDKELLYLVEDVCHY